MSTETAAKLASLLDVTRALSLTVTKPPGATVPPSVRQPTLYSLASEVVELEDLRAEAEEEGDSAAVAVIDQQISAYLKEHLPRKAQGIRGFIRDQMARSAVHKAEAARYSALAARETATVERLKALALGVMQMLNLKRLDGPLGDRMLSRRRNGGAKPLVIAQPELIPQAYRDVTVTMPEATWDEIVAYTHGGSLAPRVRAANVEESMSNQAIRHALESGEGVPGCHLAERGEHLHVE